MPLPRTGWLIAALIAVTPALAQELEVSVEGPQRVAPGETFEINWQVATEKRVLLTTVMLRQDKGSWSSFAIGKSDEAGFSARIKAPNRSGKIRFRIYTRTLNGPRGSTRTRTIEIGEQDFGLSERIHPSINLPRLGGGPRALRLTPAFPMLSFADPVLLLPSPGDGGHLFMVERAGLIRVVQTSSGTSKAGTFLDLSQRVRSGDGEGLLGLAFAPDFAESGRFYVSYTPRDGSRRLQVSSLDADPSTNLADPESEREVLSVELPAQGSPGGSLVLGPDDQLYVAVGDGEQEGSGIVGALAASAQAQDLSSLLGAVLRVTPRKQGGYRVPSDNPYAQSQDGTRREIWAHGFRAPSGLAFGAEGSLWLADHGPSRQEIDLVQAGANYGWDVFEGSQSHQNPDNLSPTEFATPLDEYRAELGTRVIGGQAYRGTAAPELAGAYIYGDKQSGRIWALSRDGGEKRQVGHLPGLNGFGQDSQGEVYALTASGRVYRLESSQLDMPQLLSQTGLFEDTAGLKPGPGVIPFDVNAPLWSDGAKKRRWIALPKGAQITFNAEQPWGFPVGTVFVKHFDLELEVGNADSRRKLETRVLVHHTDGWQGYTYRWNDQDEAMLLPGGASERFYVTDADGSEREQVWAFPSRADCMTCHTDAAGVVLGVNTFQLNREFSYPQATDNQLRALNHIGAFEGEVGEPASYPAYPHPEDEAAPLEERARAYLAVNCATCHQPDGGPATKLDLRFTIPAEAMHAIDVVPERGNLGVADARIVKPGAPQKSVLLLRMQHLDISRMPVIGSNEIDEAGVELIRRWIQPNAQPVSFAQDVQPIFSSRCTACHRPGGIGPFSLVPSTSHQNIVGRAASQLSSMNRIEPGQPGQSYLLHKVKNTHTDVGGVGVRMPLGGSPLTASQIKTIEDWIQAGAPNN